MDQNNLKTHDGLSVVKDTDGRDMSEVSITVTDSRLNGGRPTNIPSLWKGEIVSEDEAVDNVLKTGKQYKSFGSITEAVDDAVRKSDAGGANAPTNYGRDGNVQQANKASTTFQMEDGRWATAQSVYDGVEYSKDELKDMVDAGLIQPTEMFDSEPEQSNNMQFAEGGLIPEENPLKGLSYDYQSSGGSSGSDYEARASYTAGDDSQYLKPSMSSSESSRSMKYEDGVILDESGKRVGVAIDGQLKLFDGVNIRGGIEKVFSSSQGLASLGEQTLGGFSNKTSSKTSRLGTDIGNLSVDLENVNPKQGKDINSISAIYKVNTGKDSNLTFSGSADDMGGRRANVMYKKRFAQGGVAMNDQMKMFADGGMMDDSGEVVNGVEVPAGSMVNEVADDIPAQLSEGEFVIPADVVRYIGLEKLMAIRDKAKQGLARMEDIGQVGNADEVANPDEAFGDESFDDEEDSGDFEADIDNIMGEVDQEQGFASGGFVSGTDMSKAPKNPVLDIRFFKNNEGRVMFITHINGKPMTAVPDGYEEVDESEAKNIGKEADDAAAKKAEEEAAAKEVDKSTILNSGGNYEGNDGETPDSPTSPNNQNNAPDGFSSVNSKGVNVNSGLQATPFGSKGVAAAIALGLQFAGIPAFATMFALKAFVNPNTQKGINSNNASIGTTLGNAGYSPAAVAAAQAAAQEVSSNSRATPTDVAVAAANAASSVDNTTSLDAFFSVNDNFNNTPGYNAMADTPASPAGSSQSNTGGGSNISSSGDAGSGGPSGGGGGGFGPSTAGGMAKGGLVNKRPAKPKKPTKGKGLAASKK